jgi:hypothetical protein
MVGQILAHLDIDTCNTPFTSWPDLVYRPGT